MSYFDRIDWHSLAENFPKDLEPESGGTHIGMYVAWIVENNLVGEFHLEESIESLEKLRKRMITGREFLITECDSKFGEEDLNEEALEFTNEYYEQYIMDFAEMFVAEPMSLYGVEDSWENYDKLKPVLDERFRSWRAIRKIYDQVKK